MAPVAAAPRAPERRTRPKEEARASRGAAATKPRTAKSSAAPTRAQRNQRAIANARAAERAGTASPARTAPARRKSGAVATPAPARRKPAAAPRRPAASPVARVLNSRGMPLVDRVLRGPVWVVMLGVLLAGIVFLNVSVLELNRGIARTDAKSAQLERVNSGLRERVAKLDSGERIQALAAARGFVMPQPGEVTYVRPHRADAKLAAERITAPDDPAATSTAQTGYTTGVEPAGTAADPTGTAAAPTGTTAAPTGTTAAPTGTAAAPATTATPVAAPTAATTQQVP